MRRNRFTKPTRMIAGVISGLLFAILAVSLIAQPADDSLLGYDITREVTLSGTVLGVLSRPTPGMTWGSHLLIATVSGTVDASLGRWGLRGEGGLSVGIGQQVEVTGVMRTFNSKQVFVARAVKTGGKVYTMRDEHGIPISPQAREHPGQRGESL